MSQSVAALQDFDPVYDRCGSRPVIRRCRFNVCFGPLCGLESDISRGDVDHSLHGAQGMEERPWPAVLGENLTETIFARDVVVLCPIEASLDLDGGDYKLRTVERGLQRSGRADLGIATELFGKRFRVAADFQ